MKHFKLTSDENKEIVYATVAAETLDAAANKLIKEGYHVTKHSNVKKVAVKNLWHIGLNEFRKLKGVGHYSGGVYKL